MVTMRGARAAMAGFAVLGSCLALAVTAPRSGGDTVRPPDSEPFVWHSEWFRTGDLLFRRSRGLLARAVLAADVEGSTGGRYSHVGLIRVTAAGPVVIHTLPPGVGEGGRAVAEPLADFLAPRSTVAAALYRPHGAAAERRLTAVETALGYVRQGVPFDGRFDLATSDALYCTELVWAAYRAAGIDLAGGQFDRLRLPLMPGEYLLPSRLIASEHLVLSRRLSRGRAHPLARRPGGRLPLHLARVSGGPSP